MCYLEIDNLTRDYIKRAGRNEVRIKICDLNRITTTVANELINGDENCDLEHWIFKHAEDFKLLDGNNEVIVNMPGKNQCVKFCKEVYTQYKENSGDLDANNEKFGGENIKKLIKLAGLVNEKWGEYVVCFNPANGGENQMDVKERLEELIYENGKKQIILTGAPGTGKTYSVRQFVKDKISDEMNAKFVQFHPSYDYSDFVEGLRPVQLEEGNSNPTFVRMDGTFKAFCRRIVNKNIKDACKEVGYVDRAEKDDIVDELYAAAKAESDNKPETISVDIKKIYEEYKKIENGDNINNNNNRYFFVVDEINRADLSKVFGELMFGLEESYRGIENRFDTQYMNLETYEIIEKGENKGKAIPMGFDCFKKGFFIPRNLVFIGTMNNIDRSVESFDFALRRRFYWQEIKANDVANSVIVEIIKKHNKKYPELLIEENDSLPEKLQNMNGIFENYKKFGLSEDYHIGPAYFKEYDGNNLEDIFDHEIEPILREYTRGRDKNEVNNFVGACRNELIKKTDGQNQPNSAQPISESAQPNSIENSEEANYT